MTNKEVIEILNTIKKSIEWDYPLDYQIAINKAIEALKRENKKKEDDINE